MKRSRFIVWINDEQKKCRSLTAALRLAEHGLRQGKDTIICSHDLAYTLYSLSRYDEDAPARPRPLARLLYFPSVAAHSHALVQ
jgi:hypothetical protein